MYNSGNSSKNVTGASIVDGTVEDVDIASNAVGIDELKVTDGTAGQVLKTNGSGTLSFSNDIGITDVVSDTTPQLGGDLDSNGNDIKMGDNDKVTFGDLAGGDLQIYHDGSHSRIKDAGTGNLVIQADEMTIVNSANSEAKADFITNGRVGLYYDGSRKLATTSTGIDVTGTVAATAYTGDGSALSGIDALPAQSGHTGKYLGTNGTTATWNTLDTDANSTTKGLYEHANTISANYSITSGNNAMTAGPITINTGVSVTIPTGSTWVIA